MHRNESMTRFVKIKLLYAITCAAHRRPSLERQMTLYDEYSYFTDGYSSDGRTSKMNATYPECQTDIRYNEYYDAITGLVYQDER